MSDDPGVLTLDGGSKPTGSSDWRPEVRAVRDRLQREFGTQFNYCLINRYDPGDSMPPHNDSTSNSSPDIVSLSIGCTRTIEIHKNSTTTTPTPTKYELKSGDLLKMDGSRHRHCVPAEPWRDGRRFNLTFRWVNLPTPLHNAHLQQYFSTSVTAADFANYVEHQTADLADLHLVDLCAGEGALAAALCGRCRTTTVVEIDQRLKLPLMNNLPSATVVMGDALETLDGVPGAPSDRLAVLNPPFGKASSFVGAALDVADIVVVLAPGRCFEGWTPPWGTELVHCTPDRQCAFTNLQTAHTVQFRVYRRYLQLLMPVAVASGCPFDIVVHQRERSVSSDLARLRKARENVTLGYNTLTTPKPGSSRKPEKRKGITHHFWLCLRAGACLGKVGGLSLVKRAVSRLPQNIERERGGANYCDKILLTQFRDSVAGVRGEIAFLS